MYRYKRITQLVLMVGLLPLEAAFVSANRRTRIHAASRWRSLCELINPFLTSVIILLVSIFVAALRRCRCRCRDATSRRSEVTSELLSFVHPLNARLFRYARQSARFYPVTIEDIRMQISRNSSLIYTKKLLVIFS